jgi:hypothetical protein
MYLNVPVSQTIVASHEPSLKPDAGLKNESHRSAVDHDCSVTSPRTQPF